LTPQYVINTIENILGTIFDHLNNPVRFDCDDHYKCLEFRHEVIAGMKSKLEELEPLPWTSTEHTGAKEKSWDNLLRKS